MVDWYSLPFEMAQRVIAWDKLQADWRARDLFRREAAWWGLKCAAFVTVLVTLLELSK